MKKHIQKITLLFLLLAAAGASAQRNVPDKLNLSDAVHPVVAYSLRQLSQVATKAIEVRRGSDNTWQDIGFDANGDLDIGSLEEFVGAGDGFVSKWYDQSGKDIHAVQTDREAQPKIVEAGKVLMENGRPIIYTSDTHFLIYGGNQLPEFGGINTASRLSVCMIRSGTGLATIDGLGCDKLSFRGSAASVGLQVDGESQKGKDAPIAFGDRLMAVSAIRQSGNSLLYIDGEVWDKNTAELSSFSSPVQGTIGRGCNRGAADGGHSELLLFNSVLTESQIKSIASNQYQYYNLLGQLNLPKAAYGLRKISNAYNGAAIRVRRGSDDQTKDIGFDMTNGGLNIEELRDFTGAGDGYVSIWYDQSGMDRHKMQSVMFYQPQIVSKGSVIVKNGKPAIYFPAQSKVGLDGPSTDYLTEGDITICFNAWSNSDSEVPRRAIQGNGKQDWLVGPYKNSNAYRAGDWNLQDDSNPWLQTGELFTVSQPASGPNTVYRNGAAIVWYRNTAKCYPGSISVSAACVGDEPFDGYMSELWEFNKKLFPHEINRLQKGISSYFGMTASGNNRSALVTADRHFFLAVFSLRLLNGDYNGPLVRLATGDSFYDVYPDDQSGISPDSPISAAMSDFKANVSGPAGKTLSSILRSSTQASVAIWYDQSGEAGHLKQPDERYRPLLVKRGVLLKQAENGNPALEFSNRAKVHLTGSGNCLNDSEDGYINIVYTHTSKEDTPNGQYLVSKPQSWYLVIGISTHNGGGWFNMYPEGVLNEKQRVIPFFNPTIEKSSRANILSVSFNKEGVSVYGNQVDAGRSRVALPSLYGNTNTLQLGGTGIAENNENSFDGLIQELIITRGLTQEERNRVEEMQSVCYKTGVCNTWRGTDQNWNNASNWSLARVPNSADKVCIPRGCSKWPKISEPVPAPARIVVEPAAIINLEGAFSGGLPKVDLLADEESTGMVINKAGTPLGEVGIQKWFTAQKGFRLVSNPFKNTQSVAENSAKSGFVISTLTEALSTEKSPEPTVLSTVVSDAQYFVADYWKNLLSGTAPAAVPYAIHYEGLTPPSLADKENGPTPVPYCSRGEMDSGNSVSIQAANSTGQFTLAGNPFTAPVKTNALTQGAPYYKFEVSARPGSAARREESGMWIPHFPSENSTTPVLGVVAFKQTEASPSIAVPASAIVPDFSTPEQEPADCLQLDLEQGEEYRDRLYIKLADEYKSASSDKMDLEKIMNGGVNTYTMTPEKMRLSIDCRQKPVTPIPVYVNSVKEGLYTFRVRHNGLAEASEIYLKDRRLGKVTKLDEGGTYAFSVSAGEGKEENRFEIFIRGILTGMDETFKKDNGIAVYPIPAQEEIKIYSVKNIEAVTVYDLNGRVVLTKEVFGKEVRVSVNNLPHGLYVLSVKSKEGVAYVKIIRGEQ